MVINTDATPYHLDFCFQGSRFPLSCNGIWSVSLCKVHIALQELQAIVPILYKMAFLLSGMVVAFHLDNGTA